MTTEELTEELTDFFSGVTPTVDAETIAYITESLHDNGLTLETATVNQLNNLLRGEDINAWH